MISDNEIEKIAFDMKKTFFNIWLENHLAITKKIRSKLRKISHYTVTVNKIRGLKKYA